MKRTEKQELLEKLADTLDASDATRQDAIDQMSSIIREAYGVGLQMGLPMVAVDPLVTEQSIQQAISSMSSRVGYIWDSMDEQIIDTITQGIKAGKSYDGVAADLDDLIRGDWGDKVPFDNTGNVIRRVRVTPDGQMFWEDHTITRGTTIKTEVYAENLSKTVVHESWNKARDDQYDRIGLEKFAYSAVGDGATRLTHLAMHGKVIVRGSVEEQMAESLMAEYNCRCIKIPYWDDPELDTDPQKWEDEKIKAAKAIRKDIPDNTPDADFLDEIISGEKPTQINEAEFLKTVINDEKKELVGKKVEHAIVYGSDGKRLFKTSTGEKHQVRFTDEQSVEMVGARLLTHNHPNGGSLSPPDLYLASHHNIQTIRAVGTKYAYSATRKGEWPTVEKIREELAKADREVRTEMIKKLENNEITYEWANINHQHFVLEKVSKRIGFMYERVEW